MIIESWMQQDPKRTRKAGVVHYIEAYMGGNRNVKHETVVEWYRQGQKTAKREL